MSRTVVVLVDPRDAFVNAAGSLRSVTRPDWAGNMFFPFDTLFTRAQCFVIARSRWIRAVSTWPRVDADYLVLATGSSYAYPAKPTADSVVDALDDFRRTHKELAAAERLLPGYEPEMVHDLRRQLDELGIRLRLGAGLTAAPPGEPGRAGTFTVTTQDGGEITADIWFRAHGVRVNSDYLADGRLTTRTRPDRSRSPRPSPSTGTTTSTRSATSPMSPKPGGPATRCSTPRSWRRTSSPNCAASGRRPPTSRCPTR